MGKQNPPTPPNPQDTAAAATGTNISTGIANTLMGQVNQVGPSGSLTYEQTGTQSITDPYTGETYEIPQFSANMQLAPELQGIQTAIGDLSGQIGQGGNIDERLFNLGRQRIDPVLEAERGRLEQSLSDRGLMAGGEAWNAEMDAFNRRQNDAYNNLALQGRSVAMAEQMQPINQIAALLGAQRGAAPSFGYSQPAQVPTVDVGGLINNQYNQQVGNYNAQMNQRQNLLGGLFGLAAGVI
jgi:hypothetical protein